MSFHFILWQTVNSFFGSFKALGLTTTAAVVIFCSFIKNTLGDWGSITQNAMSRISPHQDGVHNYPRRLDPCSGNNAAICPLIWWNKQPNCRHGTNFEITMIGTMNCTENNPNAANSIACTKHQSKAKSSASRLWWSTEEGEDNLALKEIVICPGYCGPIYARSGPYGYPESLIWQLWATLNTIEIAWASTPSMGWTAL